MVTDVAVPATALTTSDRRIATAAATATASRRRDMLPPCSGLSGLPLGRQPRLGTRARDAETLGGGVPPRRWPAELTRGTWIGEAPHRRGVCPPPTPGPPPPPAGGGGRGGPRRRGPPAARPGGRRA